MKKILYLLVFVLISCSEEAVTPGNYEVGTEPVKVQVDWQSKFYDGGILPSWNSQKNELVGTKWILTRVSAGFPSTYPNDTIKFVSSRYYILNSNAVREYNLSSNVASTNKTLTLYYFYPFGGSHYSGEVGEGFIINGQINSEFKNIQNTTSTIKAWFVKI